MEKIELDLPVIGARILDSVAEEDGVREYHGVSWCDAVRLATYGEELLVVPGSIEVCKWAPVVLGLKEPQSEFEKDLVPRMERPVAGIYLAQLTRFKGNPDAVIIRGSPARLRELAQRLGGGALSTRYSGQIGRTAVGVGAGAASARVMLSRSSNRLLAALRRWKRFDDATRAAFKDDRVTSFFEKLIRNAVADMSMCRNSFVLPYYEDAGNISFFCTGGVTWGRNAPSDMTSGYPGRMAGEILQHLSFPGNP